MLVTCEYEVATAELSTIKVNRFMESVKHGSTVHKAEIDWTNIEIDQTLKRTEEQARMTEEIFQIITSIKNLFTNLII